VRVRKVLEGRRPPHLADRHPRGRAALDTEVAALREIIAGLETSSACRIHEATHRIRLRSQIPPAPPYLGR